MKIRASVFIKVSGVRMEREANISDSGKQVWALIQRRTAFLYRTKGKNIFTFVLHISIFLLVDSIGGKDPPRSYILVNILLKQTLLISSTITCTC